MPKLCPRARPRTGIIPGGPAVGIISPRVQPGFLFSYLDAPFGDGAFVSSSPSPSDSASVGMLSRFGDVERGLFTVLTSQDLGDIQHLNHCKQPVGADGGRGRGRGRGRGHRASGDNHSTTLHTTSTHPQYGPTKHSTTMQGRSGVRDVLLHGEGQAGAQSSFTLHQFFGPWDML